MRYKVELTEQAKSEVEAAYLWSAEESAAGAALWFQGLIDAVESLHSFPERCAMAPESEDIGQEIRQLLYGSYRLLISVEAKTVFVLHIRHVARRHMARDEF